MLHDRLSLNPLGEFIHGLEEVRESFLCHFEWAHHIEFPHDKRPCDGDGLEFSSRHVSTTSIPLTAVASSDEFLHIHMSGKPKENMEEGLGDECP